MSPEEIKIIFSFILRYGIEGSLAGLVVFLLIKNFLPGYLTEKGKNLATKEDVEEITGKVESIKTDYAKVIEEIRSNNQIKISAIEREKSLKKEIYMEAVEAITRSQNIISNFANLNMTEQQITSEFANDAGKIAKVQVVGSKETVRAVTTLMSNIGSSVIGLMLERISLMQRKIDIEIAQDQRNKHQNEIDRYINLMKGLNFEGNYDKGKWEYIKNSLQFETNQRDELNIEIDALWKTQNIEHMNYLRKTMGVFFEISALLPEVVLSVRKELELEIDPSDYKEIFDANIARGKEVFNDFINKISAQIA